MQLNVLALRALLCGLCGLLPLIAACKAEVVATNPVKFTLTGVVSPTVAGTTFSVTVEVTKDGATLTSYTGTITFTSSDTAAVLPADYTFSAGDAGMATIPGFELRTVGSQSVTVTDISDGAITDSATTTVDPGALDSLTVVVASTATAGIAEDATIAAVDAFGNTATGYTGTVALSSTDGAAVLAGDYTFTGADNGQHTLTGAVEFRTSGSFTLTATDTFAVGINGTSDDVAVGSALPATFALTGLPGSTGAGTPLSPQLTVRDGFNNVVTSYTGTVTFTSTDGGATLPADYAFTGGGGDDGVHTFTDELMLATLGSHTVTVTDTVNGALTDTSGTIDVSVSITSLGRNEYHPGADLIMVINGFGFDPTPANNTVTVNAVAATVLTASVTQLEIRTGVVNASGSVAVSVTVSATNDTINADFLLEEASLGTGGGEPNGSCDRPSMSADGRYVVFDAGATDLVAGDTNGTRDVFVYDRVTDTTTRVSVDSAGGQADGYSSNPVISADGRYIAFQSVATNLVPGDTNGQRDIFRHDRETGATIRINLTCGDNQSHDGGDNARTASISANGRYVAFVSRASDLALNGDNGMDNVYVRDVEAHTTYLISTGENGTASNGNSASPSISQDGRFVAFLSGATNLVPNDTNGFSDVFVHDRSLGTMTRVSEPSGGGNANGASFQATVSADGSWVVFLSDATDMVAGDTNGVRDVFRHEIATGNTVRVSLSSADVEANAGSADRPAITADGRFVCFRCGADNLVSGGEAPGVDNVFVRDMTDGNTTLVGGAVAADGEAIDPSMSADGLWLAFGNDGTMVTGGVSGNREVFVVPSDVPDRTVTPTILASTTRNIAPGMTIELVGYGFDATPGNNTVTFGGLAGTVTAATTTRLTVTVPAVSGFDDIVVTVNAVASAPYGYGAPGTTRVSLSTAGDETDSATGAARHAMAISADGRFVAFVSGATTLLGVGNDTNGVDDIFVRDLDADGDGIFDEPGAVTTTRVSESTAGAPSDADCLHPSISADGRFVAFVTSSAEMIGAANDTNGVNDVFVKDRWTGTCERVSIDDAGDEIPAGSSAGMITADGWHVVFESVNDEDVVGGDSNGVPDLYSFDRTNGYVTIASFRDDGSPLSAAGVSGDFSVSGDGRYVLFRSDADDIISGDANAAFDIFRADRDSDDDGTFDEVAARTAVRATAFDGNDNEPPVQSALGQLSQNGNVVSFRTTADLTGDPDNGSTNVVVRVIDTKQTIIASRSSGGAAVANGSTPNQTTSLSADGRYIGFSSDATNLVAGDTNASRDSFVCDRVAVVTSRISLDSSAAELASGGDAQVLVSADGLQVLFRTAGAAEASDTNGVVDVYASPRN